MVAEQDNIVSALAYYLKNRQPEYIEPLLEKIKSPKSTVNIQNALIKDLKEAISPAIALAIKLRCKISDDRYVLMQKMLAQVWNTESEEWIPRTLNNSGIEVHFYYFYSHYLGSSTVS